MGFVLPPPPPANGNLGSMFHAPLITPPTTVPTVDPTTSIILLFAVLYSVADASFVMVRLTFCRDGIDDDWRSLTGYPNASTFPEPEHDESPRFRRTARGADDAALSGYEGARCENDWRVGAEEALVLKVLEPELRG